MDENKEPKKKYEVSVVGENTKFNITVELDNQQFKRFIAFLMRK